MTRTSDEVLAGLGPGIADLAGPTLPVLVQALTGPLDVCDALLEPAAGRAGTPLFDAATTPFPRWLAQLGGVAVPSGYTDAQVRTLIQGAGSSTRGTVAALVGAVQATLTGTRNVRVQERTTDAYHFTVLTFAVETPNQAATLAAIASQKPVGLIFTHQIDSGQSWGDVKNSGVTFNQLKAKTVDQVRQAVPT